MQEAQDFLPSIFSVFSAFSAKARLFFVSLTASETITCHIDFVSRKILLAHFLYTQPNYEPTPILKLKSRKLKLERKATCV